MTQYGFYVNTDICTGCKACMTSCLDHNDLTAPAKFRKVWEFGGGDWTPNDDGSYTNDVFTYYVSLGCNHCDAPACVENCPTGAMQKDPETGIVNNDKEVCIGCMTCEDSCPYSHPVKLDDGLSHKCDLCVAGTEDGMPDPACVKACPVRALEFGDIEELRAKYGEENTVGTLTNETAPNVVLNLHRFGTDGDIMNPIELEHYEVLY